MACGHFNGWIKLELVMDIMVLLLVGAAVLAVVLLLVAASFKGKAESRGRKVFLLISMALVPGVWMLAVAAHDIHAMEKVDFCIKCHSMDGYYESLHSQNKDSLVAAHYQNNRVPQETACYECHADHTPVTGFVKTKMKGLHEAYLEYLGHVEKPVKMRKPFGNVNCLRCHGDAKNFKDAHSDDLAALVSGSTACLDCHDVAHVLSAETKGAE